MKTLASAVLLRLISGLMIAATGFVLGCSDNPPPCPYTGPPAFAPSAGCLVIVERRVLIVESYSGGMSPPGGKAREGESAQCAAHRETWEETGLNYKPTRLLQTFDTGFELYDCELLNEDPGTINARRSEVKRALWLHLGDFGQVSWRYEGQGEKLLKLIEEQTL